MKKIIIQTCIIILITVILFFGFEFSARLLTQANILPYYQPLKIIKQLASTNADTEDWRLTHAFLDEYYESDPVLFWKPKPNVGPFNSLGYKGPEPGANVVARKKYIITTYGDSNTQGLLTTSWPEEIEKINEQKQIDTITTNAGVAGYSSFQGLKRFESDITKTKPDAILVSFGWNDVAPSNGKPDSNYAPYLAGLQQKLNSLRLYLVFKYYVNKFAAKSVKTDIPYMPRVSLDEYKRNLETFIEVAKKNNIRVILLTRPHLALPNELEQDAGWRKYVPSYNQEVREVATQKQVELIDIEQLFENQKEFFSDECHFTEQGHRKAAEIIQKSLASH